MEKKNTILLTVIAVATLLVAVVGATFAYFTATASNDDQSAGNTNATTAKLANVTLNATSITGSNNLVYPGTMNYVGASVSADVETVEGAEDNDYTVSYTVSGKVTLGATFDHDVKYYLYKTNSSVASPVTCENVATTNNGNEVQYSQNCSIDGTLGEALTLVGGNGTITAGTTEASFTYSDTIDTDAANDDFYYLVVEYPEIDDKQDTDQGKTIKAEIVSIAANQSVPKTGA